MFTVTKMKRKQAMPSFPCGRSAKSPETRSLTTHPSPAAAGREPAEPHDCHQAAPVSSVFLLQRKYVHKEGLGLEKVQDKLLFKKKKYCNYFK